MTLEHSGVVDEWIPGNNGGWGYLRADNQIPHFIQKRQDRRIFVHRANVLGDLGALVAGQKVVFKLKPPIVNDGRDWQATDVRVTEDVDAAEGGPTEQPAGRRRRRRERERGGGDADKAAKTAKMSSGDADKAAKSAKPAKSEPSTAKNAAKH